VLWCYVAQFQDVEAHATIDTDTFTVGN